MCFSTDTEVLLMSYLCDTFMKPRRISRKSLQGCNVEVPRAVRGAAYFDGHDVLTVAKEDERGAWARSWRGSALLE
jgi:hypothetical protein